MLSEDLLRLGRELVPSGPSRPREANLRRALSCTYYAMFHAAARMCADSMIGSTSAERTERAWRQVYRSLGHKDVSDRCDKVVKNNTALGFPSGIVTFARQFPAAMSDRHRADYDPSFKPRKGTVLASVLAADQAIAGLMATNVRHWKAFSAYLLFKPPRS